MLISSILFLFIAVLNVKYRDRGVFKSLFETFTIFLFFLMTIAYLVADYFTNQGITEGVIYTFFHGLDSAGVGEYKLLIFSSFAFLIFGMIFCYFFYKFLKKSYKNRLNKTKLILYNLFLFFAFITHPIFPNLYKIYDQNTRTARDDFYDYFKIPNKNLKHNDMNLVYIYAESLERTYFNKDVFPNLMTDLDKIRKDSIDFSNIHQVIGAEITIKGMTSSQCGVPLFAPFHGNKSGKIDDFYVGTKCMGDVLSSLGYYLTYMQGSELKFAGTGNLYKTHKFNEIIGLTKLEKLLKDEDYKNGWGLYDDSLFKFAYDKFKKLSKDKKQFALVLPTIDTHHPNGQPSKSCDNIKYQNGKNSILNAVKCSDYLISKFIKKIQNSPFGKKTIIVLTSDHLALRNTATDILDKQDRKGLFLILDPRVKGYKNIDKDGSMLDVSSTIFDKLDINTTIGLGRNLFKQHSLYDKNFNNKLLGWRDDILKFWQFSKITNNYKINLIKKNIEIGDKSYAIPLLIKIDDKNSTTPIFKSKKLAYYMIFFNQKQKFIWIDECKNIDEIFEKNGQTKFCVAQGTLGGDIEFFSLDRNLTEIDTKKLINHSKINDKLFTKRLSKLDEYFELKERVDINFLKKDYPYFIKSIKGLSILEGFGRWSNGEKIEIKFNKKLPKSFKLTIITRAYKTNINKPIKIVIGKQIKYFTQKDRNLAIFRFDFRTSSKNDTITIIPPNPISPYQLGKSMDKRKLGVGLGLLRISPIKSDIKINFSEKKYPNFIKSVKGLLWKDHWTTRWLNSKSMEIKFKKNLPSNFILEIKAKTLNSSKNNPINIIIGDKRKNLTVKDSLRYEIYNINFKDVKSKTIKITTPNLIPLIDQNETIDLSMGIIWLKIFKNKK